MKRMSSTSIISPLLFTLISLLSLFILTQAIDTITHGQSLRDGDSLVSAGKVFELGFFSPKYSNNRYVGIWYHDFTPNTILWVANRDSPVPDKAGSLTVSADGNLILVDAANKTLWSSNAPSHTPSQAILKLLDSGNLQLNSSGGVAWQSFDYPTDTYLPGMKLGLDLVTSNNQLLKSWKTAAEPATGNYSIGMDPARSTQIFIWDGTKPRWRSGRWNGQVFIGIEYMVPFYINGFQVSNYKQEGKMYFYYPTVNISHRFVLTWDGVIQHLVWNQDANIWSQIWAQPTTECEFYNKCGKNGICTSKNTPICDCLEGFVPKSIDEWNNGNWMSGCIRRTPLPCENNGSSNGGETYADGFLKIQKVKVPDLAHCYQDVTDVGECEQTCRTYCSCKAYSYVTGIGCLIWGVDLLDVHVLNDAGNDLYLRLAASELGNNKKKKNAAAIVIAITVVAVIIISVGGSCLIWKYRKGVKEFIKQKKCRGQGRVREGPSDHFGGVFAIRDKELDGKSKEFLLLSFDSIVAATENFSLLNLLGKGGFGPVYKGTLPDGQEIAVKRLSRSSGQGLEEFKNEIILISKLQHRNLVRLLGCCIQGEENILIYEYMLNKSLDAFVFDTKKKQLLQWDTRYKIIQGILRGLLYLHRDSRLRVIHRDLKASNILLDEEMNPKISDFGMARIFGRDDKETNTKRVVGTYGYMSPEYAMQGVFSVKSDVYSFGVLLLEIVSGEKNSTYEHPEFSFGLLPYAWKLWDEDNAMEFVDPSIRDSCSPMEASRCIHVGLLCVQDRAIDRPTMPVVVAMLESGTSDLALPRQPTFVAERTPNEADMLILDRKISASVSFTTLTGR